MYKGWSFSTGCLGARSEMGGLSSPVGAPPQTRWKLSGNWVEATETRWKLGRNWVEATEGGNWEPSQNVEEEKSSIL